MTVTQGRCAEDAPIASVSVSSQVDMWAYILHSVRDGCALGKFVLILSLNFKMLKLNNQGYICPVGRISLKQSIYILASRTTDFVIDTSHAVNSKGF
jgi:hypothetical protein